MGGSAGQGTKSSIYKPHGVGDLMIPMNAMSENSS